MQNSDRHLHQQGPVSSEASLPNLDRVQTLIQERTRRFDNFPAELFGAPAWDILLELYAAHVAGEYVTTGQLAAKLAIPETTAVRWMKVLDAAGYVLRRVDPLDTRRVSILLTVKTTDAMDRFLAGRSEEKPAADHAAPRLVRGDPMRGWA